MVKSRLLLFSLWLLVLLTGTACASPEQEEQLVIFAAASLGNAFDELADQFEAQHPVQIIRHYAGSSQLAIQLLDGAQVDIFASANSQQMEQVVEAGLIAGEPLPFAANQIAIITPIDNPAGIDTLADLSRPGVKLVLAAPDVPVREYSDQVLANLAADPAYGIAFTEGVYTNLVSEEDNVRRVVAKIVLGEADAGLVYRSDVTPDIAEQVLIIPLPPEYNIRASYPIGLLKNSHHPELAAAFIEFVFSEEGQAILARWGLEPVEVSAKP